jgi:hypothetical protein
MKSNAGAENLAFLKYNTNATKQAKIRIRTYIFLFYLLFGMVEMAES